MKRSRDVAALYQQQQLEPRQQRVSPIRLLQPKTLPAANNSKQGCAQAPPDACDGLCLTLRQILGFDGNQPNAFIDWLVISNYLIDPEALLQEVPEILSIGCTVAHFAPLVSQVEIQCDSCQSALDAQERTAYQEVISTWQR